MFQPSGFQLDAFQNEAEEDKPIIFNQGTSAATLHYLRLLREDEEATAMIMAFLEVA